MLPRCCLPVLVSLPVLLQACGQGAARAAPAPPSSVILISIDTLRPDRLGAYGYGRPTSPFLDQLAREGVLFENALSPAPWTLPAHSALLTALHPAQFELGSWSRPGRIPDGVTTLAEALAQAGFQCQAVVDGGFLAAQFGFDQGFAGYLQAPSASAGAYRASDTVDRALEWLSRRDPVRPYFLFLHTYAVHDYNPPEAARTALVRPYQGSLPQGSLADFLQNRKYQEMVRQLGDAERGFVSDLYDAAILSVDTELARLCGELERQGLLDRTLLVVTSDHGEELFDRDGTGHGYTLYAENLRVPLLLVHPSLPAVRVRSPARLQDVAPTILALLQVPPPPPWQGVSLVPALGGDGPDLVSFADDAHVALRAVQKGRWKYIRGELRDQAELYDLAADPGERKDLAGRGLHEEFALQRELNQWRHTMDELRAHAGAAALDPELRAQLERLGYVQGD